MTSAKSITRNFSIQLIGKILSVLIGLACVAVITRALGAHAYGEYTTAITFLQMFGVVVDFGLTLTLIVMISEHGADEEKIVGNFFGLRLVSGFLFFSLAPLTVLTLPWSQTIDNAVLVGAFAYFLMGGATMLIGVFQRHESMWRAALAETLNRIFLLAFVCIAAYLSFGVVGMIVASVIANAIWLFLMMRFARPFVRVVPRFETNEWLRIIARSWPIAISIIFNLLYLKGDVLFLAYFRDQSEVGFYGMAYRIIDVMTALPTMFMGLALPGLVAAWSAGNKIEFKMRVARIFDLFAMAVVPVIVGTQLIAEDLTVLIAGQEFARSGEVLRLLIFALVGVFTGTLFGHLVVAINRQKIMTWGYAAVAIISIAGYYLFIPRYGMWGAVWVTLTSEFLIGIITFALVAVVSGVKPRAITTLKSILAAAIMYFFISQISHTNVVVELCAGALVYLLSLVALRAITISQIKSIIPSK
jgi:O-antigen/teichoic acid export membrane protein